MVLVLLPTENVKYLGVVIDMHLNWNIHFENLYKKLAQANGILSKIRHNIPRSSYSSLYYSIFHSHLVYGAVVWQYTSKKNLDRIFKLQKRCLRILNFSDFTDHTNPLFISSKIMKLEDVLINETLKVFVRSETMSAPTPIIEMLQTSAPTVLTRSATQLRVSSFNTIKYGKNSLKYAGKLLWNNFRRSLPTNFNLSLKTFKKHFKQSCLSLYEST